MKVTAAVSTKDRGPELARLLESLGCQERKPDQLIVIDAASDPGVEALVKTFDGACGAVEYHALECSLPQARNFAASRAAGEVIVFLDDDLVLEPGFIREVVAPIERDAEGRVAGVTGDIVNHPRASGGLKRLFKLLFMLPMDGDGRFRLSGAPTTPHGMPEEREVEFLPGGLTAWRASVVRELGFDGGLEGLGINEDVDFSWRASRRWVNVYTPRARVLHLRPSLEREASLAYLRQELSSAWRLYLKNLPKDPLHSAAFAWSLAGLLARFAFRRWLR